MANQQDAQCRIISKQREQAGAVCSHDPNQGQVLAICKSSKLVHNSPPTQSLQGPPLPKGTPAAWGLFQVHGIYAWPR